MKCNCDYDLRYDPAARMLVAGMIAAFTTEYLVFRKTEWIEDCGFIYRERDVELPRNFEEKAAKIRCFTECLALLDAGWKNEIAERNRERMEEYLGKDTE